MSYNTDSLRTKIAKKVKVLEESGCLEWTGHRSPKGYARLRIDGKWVGVHKLVYEGAHGPTPAGVVVMHSCDNRACVNLAHLKAGTQAANVADMHAKGRARYLYGTDNHKTKLSDAQVRAIRTRYVRYSREHGAGALAREYGVSTSAINAVVHHRSHTKTP